MRRSHYRRQSTLPSWLTGRRRVIAVVATLVAFGAIVTVTQVSNASTEKSTKRALAACNNIQAPKASKLSSETRKGTYTTNNGKVTQHSDDGASDVPTAAQMRARCRDWVMQNQGGASPAPSTGNQGGGATAPPPGAGLGILTNSCDTSTLAPHTGFQDGDRCVSTEFGEVGSAANNPSLLITEAPTQVAVNTPFTLKVSTRNLIRDRFLAAGAGGYYVESSVLQGGIVRGHFHTACRMLANTDEAPAPDPVPAFFVATEDKKGGAAPDVVTIQVPGLPSEGIAQCASWAGDGSHRIPMMQRANQTPAADAVRIEVTGGDDDNGDDGDDNGDQGDNNGGQQGDDQNNDGQDGGGATDAPTTAPPANGDEGDDNGDYNGGGGGEQDPADDQPVTTPTTTKPANTTKSVIVKPAPTTKPATTTKSNLTKSDPVSDEDVTEPEQPAVEKTTSAPTTKRTVKPSKSAAAAGDYTYSNDDGAPDANQDSTQVVADPPVDSAKSGGKLALTGANSITFAVGGVLLVLLGLVALGVTRRRRAATAEDWD